MKSPRPSLYLPAAVFALSLACPLAPVRAQDDLAKRRAAAEELLKVRKTEDIVNNTVTRMGEMTDKISDNAAKQSGETDDKHELKDKMRAEARKMIRDNFNWDLLRPEYVQVYSETFTEAELKDMIAFYKTPVGQKIVAKEPEIMSRLGKFGQEKAVAVMPRVVQHLREMAAAAKPGGPPALTPPALPPGMMTPPPPPPSMMVPPAPPTGTVPPAPSAVATPTPPAPATSSSVHPNGKTEGGGL